ncbi:hypothetical protein [Chelativorans sp. J32]|uniref:hypothetical protein n=1 Tax=Chelativorans sp. J32 TaxID=935840 RepID=UPI0004AE9B83|nr:hypothetical protein [Chelativorans sp. J32]
MAKLLTLQKRVKELHEARHAAFLKEAAAAEREATEIARRLEASESLAALFPDLYHRRIAQALARREANEDKAAQEARKIAAADARANIVERAHREVLKKHERNVEEKAILEFIEQRLKPGASD